MSWYDESWTYRWPVIALDSTSGTGARDISIALPAEWAEFWKNVKSAGEDIRVTAADGVTIAGNAYQLVSFNSTTRTGTIQIDDYSAPTADGYYLLWLYFGNASASSAAGSFTFSAADTGRIHPGKAHGPIVTAQPAAPGVTAPPATVAKTTKETIFVWFDVGPLLEGFAEPHEGHAEYEEPAEIAFEVLSSGTDQAAEHDDSYLRMLPNGLIRVQVSTSGTDVDRTLSLEVTTSTDRVLNPRALLKVRDPDES